VPTTISGFVFFVVLLVPGFIHYVQRRSRVPQRSLSPLVEIATLATVSLATNLVAIAVFGLVRWIAPDHTPNVGEMILRGSAYIAEGLAIS
jgi:hypothetical protein